jgi:hypothetical protein
VSIQRLQPHWGFNRGICNHATQVQESTAQTREKTPHWQNLMTTFSPRWGQRTHPRIDKLLADQTPMLSRERGG